MTQKIFIEDKIVCSLNKSRNQGHISYNEEENPRGKINSLPRIKIKHFHLSPAQKKRRQLLKKPFFTPKQKKENENFLDSYFKMKKIQGYADSPKPRFKTQEYCLQTERVPRLKDQINSDIQKSLLYVQHLKNKKSIFLTSDAAKSDRDKEEAKNLQTISSCKKKMGKSQSCIKETMKEKKNVEPVGLYSYLQRQLIDKKNPQLTEQRIERYAKSPKNREFQIVIREKTRKLLKYQAKHNFREYKKVYDIVRNQSKQIISKQLSSKRNQYSREFSIRNSVPYFSFLTLSPKQKQSILKNLQKHQETYKNQT